MICFIGRFFPPAPLALPFFLLSLTSSEMFFETSLPNGIFQVLSDVSKHGKPYRVCVTEREELLP